MSKPEPYYIGLDCGTSSVGWTVTDDEYNLKRAKGKDLWGARLFEEAQPAAERRTHRSSRRRLARAKSRIKLLELLFSEEMSKLDPDFYLRLKESFYSVEDKNPKLASKNTLFNDKNFTDKDLHKQFPTIWHLRKFIVENSKSPNRKSLDLRFYFLAIHHIYKHRGHFLLEGKIEGAGNFSELFSELRENLSLNGISIDEIAENDFKKILTDKIPKLDKKKLLADFFELPENFDKKAGVSLGALLAGSDNVDLTPVFSLEEELKASFSKGDFEEKILPELEARLLPEQTELVKTLKKLYDYQILEKLLKGHTTDTISYAMVDNYDLHQKHLRALKDFFRSNQEIYVKLFKTELYDESFPSYTAYVGRAYTEKAGRKTTARISQDDFNAFLSKLLKENNYVPSADLDLLALAENGELLPKQRGQAKGTIPEQLHHKELEIIVSELAKDFPSFAKPVKNESETYNTKCKKLLKIHSFRIPYYIGPLVSKNKSNFSWADEEISELIRPWNFSEIFNETRRGDRAEKFIRRMTNSCTYLLGEDVLPKASLDYQKYMVLNELNNLRLNGRPLDIKLKQDIFDNLFKTGELKGNITLKILKKSLLSRSMIYGEDELTGTNEQKFLPTLSTQIQLTQILGPDFEKKYPRSALESIIESATALNEEKDILEERITTLLPTLSNDIAKTLSKKLHAKDWGNFSQKFLTGIFAEIDGRNMSILDALYETGDNLMALLSSKHHFKDAIDEHNQPLENQKSQKPTYADIKGLYCSPAVKRTIWQALKIVRELRAILKSDPKKIFLESTRGVDKREADRLRNKSAKSRFTRFSEQYAEFKNDSNVKDIIKELSAFKDAPNELLKKKLYLYFSQMGRCAYSGERISLEDLNNVALYDIDHIYPRSLTKDDSLERNLVLVKAELNRSKTNVYPLKPEIQAKMKQTWGYWKSKNLITTEKYERLTRTTELTPDELGNFVSRQLVETAQSVKVLRDVLAREFPETKIVLVRGNLVSSLRRELGEDKKDEDGNLVKKGAYEFIKIRNLNDLHHAKDAYLNIVVGNVINSTFTDDPRSWIAKRNGKNYSIRTSLLFRPSLEWRKKDGSIVTWPEMQGWHYANSLKIMSKTMQKNSPLITRMTHEQTGALFDLQIVPKSPDNIDLLPIKKNLDVKKYGGFNKAKGAYFALIETRNNNDEPERRIVQIPIIAKTSPESYLSATYPDSRIILPKIPFKSKLIINDFPTHLSGKTGNSLIVWPAFEIVYDDKYAPYIKAILEKNDSDILTKSLNEILFDEMMQKLEKFKNMPTVGGKIPEIQQSKAKFKDLSKEEQITFLKELFKLTKCNAEKANLSSIVSKASNVGATAVSTSISNLENIVLVQESPTGLFEKRIDLRTYEPGDKI